MKQCNRLNMKLSNWQLNKLKSAIKIETDVVIRSSPNMIGDSNDEANFPHELLLTDRQVSSICKAFANNSSVDFKLSKLSYQNWYNQEDVLVNYRSFIKNWITADKKCNYTISKKRINSLRINCSSMSSRCRNT